MSRRVVLLLMLLVVLVLGAATALVLSGRSALDDDRAAVDARWEPLRTPLAARYTALAGVGDALAAAGAQDRTYTADLRSELETWAKARNARDAAAEVASANRLEGIAGRIRANVFVSARLSQDPGVQQALEAFDVATVPPPDVNGYNRAVRRYQRTRTSSTKRLPASILGYESRPVLVIAGDAG